ncbi:MAG: enoyl-CoA hydratase family protein [Pseudomonadota bacterium]
MTSLFHRDRCEGYSILWNANPKRKNALSEEYYNGVISSLSDTAYEDQTGAFILAGEGGYFCSGGDLRILKERRNLSIAERQIKINRLHDVVRAIRNCPKPVIAAVEGGAAGAGFSIALACDMIIAAENAKFTLAYARAGLTPDGGATHMLMKALPRATVSRMALLGAPVTANRLYELGVLTELTAPGKALTIAKGLAQEIAAGPQNAITAIKTLLNAAQTATLEAQLDAECHAMSEALGGEEAQHRIDALVSKVQRKQTRP